MEPYADTANPAYRFPNPPGQDDIIFPASISPMDFVPAEACSNGASIVLEHAAARPEARVLLSPSTIAEDDDDDEEDKEDDDSNERRRRRRRCVRSSWYDGPYHWRSR
jgi:hypothetical protein